MPEPPGTGEVFPLSTTTEMVRTVVLVNRSCPVEEQVGAGDEHAPVEDLVLRLDGHVADSVQHSQKGLPGRLRVRIHRLQHSPEQGRSSPSWCGRGNEVFAGARSGGQSGAQDHEVKEAEVPRTCKESLRRRRQRDTVLGHRNGCVPMTRDQEFRPLWPRVGFGHGEERREVCGQWRKPPTVLPRRSEVREDARRREHEPPRQEVV